MCGPYYQDDAPSSAADQFQQATVPVVARLFFEYCGLNNKVGYSCQISLPSLAVALEITDDIVVMD
jgi:hypothetical protein